MTEEIRRLGNCSSPSTEDELDGKKDRVQGIVKCQVVAKFNYKTSVEDELTFRKGDVITVTKIMGEGWWEGTHRGKTGWFPSNYVREMESEVQEESVIGEEYPEYYKDVLDDLISSERSHVESLQKFQETYVKPLTAEAILTENELKTVCGNLTEVVEFQNKFVQQLEIVASAPFSKQKFGSLFLQLYPQFRRVHESYCGNHPYAVALVTDNQERLGAFMESRGAPVPGLLTLTMSLSLPFRRLEKYPTSLLELHRQIGDKHLDCADCLKASETFGKLKDRVNLVRKRKEMEQEMLSGTIEGWTGTPVSELGKCNIMLPVTQHLDGNYDDRFLLLFPSTFVVLSVSPTLSGYCLEKKFSISDVTLKSIHESDSYQIEMTAVGQKYNFHCASADDKDSLMTNWEVFGHGLRRPSVSQSPASPHYKTLFASQAPTGLNAAAAKLFNRKQKGNQSSTSMSSIHAPITRPTYWGFRSLRPAPPAKANALQTNEDHGPKSPKSSNKRSKAVKKGTKKDRYKKKPVNEADASLEDDDAILKVIEAYCLRHITALTPDHLSGDDDDFLFPSARSKSLSLKSRYK
ncbi:rho guanine nucleotide exchange factor 7-like isoform X2 [Oscarella lobularis]|uniref:rho guanine nucleotide exchange factor 7-like isoform X2 n=1 Tax=Oscarella lobularis TaxID=121494 RepID=UPI0033135DCD